VVIHTNDVKILTTAGWLGLGRCLSLAAAEQTAAGRLLFALGMESQKSKALLT